MLFLSVGVVSGWRVVNKITEISCSNFNSKLSAYGNRLLLEIDQHRRRLAASRVEERIDRVSSTVTFVDVVCRFGRLSQSSGRLRLLQSFALDAANPSDVAFLATVQALAVLEPAIRCCVPRVSAPVALAVVRSRCGSLGARLPESRTLNTATATSHKWNTIV